MNTIALMKSAPFWNSDFAIAVAAYEQDELTIPKNVARPTAPGPWSPKARCISSLETNAWTTPDSVKPSTSAQRVPQNMKNPSRRLSRMLFKTERALRSQPMLRPLWRQPRHRLQ